jgi:ABC-type lipoprotein release transport system permease subunit
MLLSLFSLLALIITCAGPLTFVTTATVLAAVAVAACVLPARRTASVDPMMPLRNT